MKRTAREHSNEQKCQEIPKLKGLPRRILPGSTTIKRIAVKCWKQNHFQGVSKTKGLTESITDIFKKLTEIIAIKGLQGSVTRYCQEVSQIKYPPVRVTIKRNS